MLSIICQIVRAAVTIGDSFRQALEADASQFLRNLFTNLSRRLRISVLDFVEQFVTIFSFERTAAREYFIQNYALAPEFAASVQAMRFATYLFGRHVSWSTGHFATAAALDRFVDGQSEIGHARTTRSDSVSESGKCSSVRFIKSNTEWGLAMSRCSRATDPGARQTIDRTAFVYDSVECGCGNSTK